jgi:hypothetical protein
MVIIIGAAAATAAYRAALETKRAEDAAKAQETPKPFDEAAWLEKRKQRVAALPAELAQARKEYKEYFHDLIATAIQEDTVAVGYWDLQEGAMKKRTVCMEEFRCQPKHCCGEEFDGEPAMLDWTFTGLNSISAWDFIVPSESVHAALLGRPIFDEIKEELEALGYTVAYEVGGGCETLFQITYPV